MTPLSELTLETAPKALFKEWLGTYFDGAAHVVGSNAAVVFPRVGLAFGQSAIEQPLASVDNPRQTVPSSAEIRVLCFPRRETLHWNSDVLDGEGLLATDYVQFQFQVRSGKPKKEDREYERDRVAQLLKAILTNPDPRLALARAGITHLQPMKPAPVEAKDYAMAIVNCPAQLQYAIKFGDTMTTISAEDQSVPFVRESPLVPAEYLMGWFRWSVPVLALSATVVAFAGASDTVLELEVNGVLTGKQLTIPAGTPNTEVTDAADLDDLVIGRDQGVRWKIISGPAVLEDAAYHVTVTLQVRPQ